MGVWVKSGSRYETQDINGISHFIEHMLFKGTQRRNAKELALEIDNIGGQINAFTAKEYTCFYTKTLDSHIHIAIDVLADMITNSTLKESDVDLERNVVFEEISMCEDTPEDLVHEMIGQVSYKSSSLGYTILGTHESLDGINSSKMRKYMSERYTSDNMVISVAGNFDEQKLAEMMEKAFSSIKKSDAAKEMPKAEFESGKLFMQRDIEQVQVCISFDSVPAFDDRIMPMQAFNAGFGLNTSGTLFQKIREERALVYSIYAYPVLCMGTGMFVINFGATKNNVEQVLSMIKSEIDLLKKDKCTPQEIALAKEQLKGSFILSNEGVGSRMQQAGRRLLFCDDVETDDQILEHIDAIDCESVSKVIDTIFDYSKMSVAAIGNIEGIDFDVLGRD